MKCIERIEIEKFIKGNLAPEQMLAVDSHIHECANCKKLAIILSSRVDLASAVTGASDCPEYEDLSAYVDKSLNAARTTAVSNHANLCEYCAGDLERIREMRSHAALRQKITVKPGASRVRQHGFFVYWKQVLAIGSLAGLAAIALMFNNSGGVAPKDPAQVAAHKPINHAQQVMPKDVPKPEPVKVAIDKPQAAPIKVAVNDPKPAPIVTPPLLRDGRYSVVRKGGALSIAKADGSSVGSRLEARMAARIDEKLRTGKITLPEPVRVAMGTFTMRAEANGYDVPPAAPKPIGPIGRIVMSATPTFNWTPVDLADAYHVQVYDESGNVVADHVTKNTNLVFSSPLARGKTYSWRVSVRFGEEDSWTRSGSSAFFVLSAQDFNSINNVRTKLRGSHLAMGAAYESAGLYEEATNEYRLLRRANPKSKLAKDLLYGVSNH